MSTIADEIDNRIQIAQERMERSPGGIHNLAGDAGGLRPRIVLPGVMLAVLAAGAGLIVYRRRRSLAQRLQIALSDSVRDLPDELRVRLKRPLRRAARAL